MTKKDLSFGQLVSREQLKNLKIPGDITQSFQTRNFLVVIAPRSNILKINVFPTDSKSITKIIIYLREFSPFIVKKIASIIRKLDLPNLYTSGVCLQEDRCVYEAYIEFSKLSVGVDVIREEFEAITDIESVKIEQLTFE